MKQHTQLEAILNTSSGKKCINDQLISLGVVKLYNHFDWLKMFKNDAIDFDWLKQNVKEAEFKRFLVYNLYRKNFKIKSL
jgi:hypothetical protein